MTACSNWLTTVLVVTYLVCSQAASLESATPPDQPVNSGTVLRALQSSLATLYNEVNPSVVNIRVTQKGAAQGGPESPMPGLPFLRPPNPQEPREFRRHGMGSGFIWDQSGHVVSNNHVVADADEISVTLHDGTIVPARLVGADPDSDLAVIKVMTEAPTLKPVRLGDSTQLKVGQLAIAIGNPFGLASTMTVGFVSALGRLLPVESGLGPGSNYTIPDIIQTDASINPGNSGGVLVDDSGSVIGVTTAILSPVGASVGIGFAVPAAIVQKVVPALIKDGRYIHPWLGLGGVALTPDLSRAMGLDPAQRGALIIDVVAGGPADKAGLRGSGRQAKVHGQNVRVGGDVILAIGGQPVKDFDDLIEYLARSGTVGQNVSLKFLRRGKEMAVEATLAPRPGSGDPTQSLADAGKMGKPWLGVTGLNMNPQIAKAMGLPEDQKGVLVEQVMNGGSADKANLRGSYKPLILQGQQVLVGGDVIVGINDYPIRDMRDLLAAIAKSRPGDIISLDLVRDGKKERVPLTVMPMPAK